MAIRETNETGLLVGYIRVSVLPGAEEAAMDAVKPDRVFADLARNGAAPVQRKAMAAIKPAKVYEDFSADFDENCPALRECLRYLRKGDTFAFYSNDRIAADPVLFEEYRAELEARGVKLRCLRDEAAKTEETAKQGEVK